MQIYRDYVKYESNFILFISILFQGNKEGAIIRLSSLCVTLLY
jgi:hypothetical protein